MIVAAVRLQLSALSYVLTGFLDCMESRWTLPSSPAVTQRSFRQSNPLQDCSTPL